MLDDKRRGRGAAPAVIEASSSRPGSAARHWRSRAQTYTVAPAAMKGHAGLIAGEITDMQVVQRVERRSGRVIFVAEARGDAQALE